MNGARSSQTVPSAYRRALMIGCLVLLSLCGCASMKAASTSAKPAGTQVAVPTGSKPQSTPAPPPAASPGQLIVSSADDTGASSAMGVEHPAPAAIPQVPGPATSSNPVKSKSPAGELPVKQADAAAQGPRPPPTLATSLNKPSAAPALDLADLEQRLRDTRAIGVFAKLSLKNQVDDLLSEFRTQYRGSNKHPSPELRQRYDLLILKVLSLLQDSDPQLAAAISSSREAIWGILADPDKFEKI
jgi:hypothetical protein